jgi:hypothetical protein
MNKDNNKPVQIDCGHVWRDNQTIGGNVVNCIYCGTTGLRDKNSSNVKLVWKRKK